MLDKESDTVKEMSLLDQILQMIADCILLTTGHPEAFDFSETQEKEFNKWKQDILVSLCRILQQVEVSLNIVGRKMKGRPPSKQEFRFSVKTLNRIFKILFFAEPESAAHRGAQALDNSQRSIAVVSKVLNRISMMPLQMPENQGQTDRGQEATTVADQQVNLLKLYQTASTSEVNQIEDNDTGKDKD